MLNSKISNTFAASKKGSIMRVFTKGKANILMAFVFIWYLCGISLNPHTHIVDGSVVAHSHPFSKDGHTHTSSQVQTIYELSHYQASGSPEIIELPVLICILAHSVSLLTGKRKDCTKQCFPHRNLKRRPAFFIDTMGACKSSFINAVFQRLLHNCWQVFQLA